MTEPTDERWRQAVAERERRRQVKAALRAEMDRARRYAKDRGHIERLARLEDTVPRRNANGGPRQTANWSTREPARLPCGCRRDGTWRCDPHFAEHRAARRDTAEEPR